LAAFDQEQRYRYDTVRAKVRGAVRTIRELEDGFAMQLVADREVLGAAGEWIALERRCCPFFTFVLHLPAGDEAAELRITGPDPAKEILREAVQPRPDVPAARLSRR